MFLIPTFEVQGFDLAFSKDPVRSVNARLLLPLPSLPHNLPSTDPFILLLGHKSPAVFAVLGMESTLSPLDKVFLTNLARVRIMFFFNGMKNKVHPL